MGSLQRDTMADPETPVTTLKCVDGESVVIGIAYIERCQLIKSLPSLPDEIAVPFSEDVVSTWYRYCDVERPLRGVGFLECVSIMKVADFLHDEDAVEAAAKAANAILMQPSRKRKLSAPRPKEASKRFVTALKSLPAHMSQEVLKAGGQLQDWMRVLPPSCLPIMVPAAVTSGTLRLHPDQHDSEVLKQMITLAKPLGTVHNLEVVFTLDRGASSAASQAVESIGTMTQLKGLRLYNMSVPEIPAALTALTHLRMDNSDARSPRAKLTTDMSVFTALKELAVVNVLIFNFENFSNQLRSLTALTSLELCCPVSKDRQIAITGQMSKTFADALTTLTSLATLTLGVPQTIQESEMRSFQRLDTVAPQLHNSIIRSLSDLPSLTSLSFAGLVDCRIDPTELEVAWLRLSTLRSLRIQSERHWVELLPSLRHLRALEHFHLDSRVFMHVSYALSSQVPYWLPSSLISLKMDVALPVMPNFSELSNLQSIELNGCCMWCEGALPPSMSALTGLTSLHTGPPFTDPVLFKALARSTPGKTPEKDLGLFLSGLPESLVDLRMPEQNLPEFSMQFLSRLSSLRSLDIGDIASNSELVALSGAVCALLQLRMLRVRCGGDFVSQVARNVLLSALVKLHCFEELHHGPDPEGLWVCEVPGEMKFKLIAD